MHTVGRGPRALDVLLRGVCIPLGKSYQAPGRGWQESLGQGQQPGFVAGAPACSGDPR